MNFSPRRTFSGAFVLFAALVAALPAFATRPWTYEQIREEMRRREVIEQPPFVLPRSPQRRDVLDDPAYFAHFQMLCEFLASMQFTGPGLDNGGMIEGESGNDANLIETDNTQEAIREWSQYAIWTGDTARYRVNIDHAKTYCGFYPAWHEGDGGYDYYSAHNCGWGFEAVRKYRQAYGDTTWNWYADSCAVWMVAHPLSWSVNNPNAYAEALGLGGMYSHAVYRARQDWINHCLNRARALRTWLQTYPNMLHSESWALSGGTAVWGLTESLFAQYPDSGAMWVEQWGSQVQVWESAGQWNHSFSAWYANAQHRMFELSGDSIYWNNAVYIGDSLIGLDTDDDGGIMPGIEYPDTNDHSWVSAYMGWMGMERVINGTTAHDVAAWSFVSPNDALPYLAGDPLTVAVQLRNNGRESVSGILTVTGGSYLDSAPFTLTVGGDTILALPLSWIVPDSDQIEQFSTLTAVTASDSDSVADNDTVRATFDIRRQVQVFGTVRDADSPNQGVPAQIDVFHEGYPDSVWTTLTADANGSYATGARPLMEGTNRLVVNPPIQHVDAETTLAITSAISPLQQDFALNRTDIALVDDDADQTYESWYVVSLDSFPALHTRVWHRSAAELTDFNAISTVIWFCGDDSITTLETQDQTLLQDFLTGGGHLILTGQNITEDEAAASFLNSVLQCSLRTRDTRIRAVNGIAGNPLVDGVQLLLLGLNGARNQTSPASIYSYGTATEILRYTSGDEELCGISGAYGTGSYVFLSFGLEAVSGLNNSTTRRAFLDRCFRWFGDSLTFVDVRPELPTTIWLAQNYPNPFNPSTTIQFSSPTSGAPVTLSVYNTLGQKIRSLFNGSAQRSSMTVSWDGRTDGGTPAASGFYVYRLESGNLRMSRTLQLIR